MRDVNAATPASPPPANPADAERPPQPRKRGRMLSDERLMEIHKGNPPRGVLATIVRRAIIDRCPDDTWAAFAQMIHSKMKTTSVGTTRESIRTRLCDQFRDPAGPARETIVAALLLAVGPTERDATATKWTEQYARAHPKSTGDGHHDFVEILRHPEYYLKNEYLRQWTDENSGSVPGGRTASTEPSDEQRSEAVGDEKQATDEDGDRLDPFKETLNRYAGLGERLHITDEEMNHTFDGLAQCFSTEVIEPAEDVVRTTDIWQKSARDQPVTVGLPLNVRRAAIAVLIAALLIALSCLGYKVSALL